jgi:hypothetical protein
MRLDEFNSALDQIEIDPRARIKVCAGNLVNQELRRHGLTDDQCERFGAPALKELFDNAKTAIERGNFADIDKHIVDFQFALRRRVQLERQTGELRPITAESETKDHREALAAKLYHAPECDAIRHLMQPGERILKVDWHSVETDRQVIQRRDLPRACRPISFRNGVEWRKQFVSDREIEEEIEREADRSRPIKGQTISPWID